MKDKIKQFLRKLWESESYVPFVVKGSISALTILLLLKLVILTLNAKNDALNLLAVIIIVAVFVLIIQLLKIR